MTARQLRPLVLAFLALLSAMGWISPDLKQLVEANADTLLAGVLAAWAIIAHLRNRKDAQAPLAGRTL